MSAPSKYRDKRSEFFRSAFERASTYEKYLASSDAGHVEKWSGFAKRIKLEGSGRETVKQFKRTLNVLVLSGVWCGDCARQGPMLEAIERANPVIRFRYLDSRSEPELQEELRINGAEKVPVVVVLSEDFYEVARFGDRHLSVYRRKAADEAGVACDPGLLPPSEAELKVELGEWVHFFERLELMLRLAPALRQRYSD